LGIVGAKFQPSTTAPPMQPFRFLKGAKPSEIPIFRPIVIISTKSVRPSRHSNRANNVIEWQIGDIGFESSQGAFSVFEFDHFAGSGILPSFSTHFL
jgi:hypothetical protein